MFKVNYEYLGKYYEFNHIGVEFFDLYKKSNGKMVKTDKQGSPYLTTKSAYEQYVRMLELKGYRSMGLLKKINFNNN